MKDWKYQCPRCQRWFKKQKKYKEHILAATCNYLPLFISADHKVIAKV